MLVKLSQTLSLIFLSLVLNEARADGEAPLRALQQAELAMFRAGTDLFVHRGEDRSAPQAALVEADLGVLQASLVELQGVPEVQAQVAELMPLQQRFSQRVRETLAYDPLDPDLPWEFNFEFSKVQRELWMALQDLRVSLLQVQKTPLTTDQLALLELPCKVQALAERYVARAYIGDIETLADQQQLYINQDLDQLAHGIDSTLTELNGRLIAADQQAKLKQVSIRWKFIYGPLRDYSKDMAPLMVERHSREIVKQLGELLVI